MIIGVYDIIVRRLWHYIYVINYMCYMCTHKFKHLWCCWMVKPPQESSLAQEIAADSFLHRRRWLQGAPKRSAPHMARDDCEDPAAKCEKGKTPHLNENENKPAKRMKKKKTCAKKRKKTQFRAGWLLSLLMSLQCALSPSASMLCEKLLPQVVTTRY